MFCYNCGKEIPENALFCPFCGTQVNVSVSSDITSSADDVQPANEPVQEPVQEPDQEPVQESAGNSAETKDQADEQPQEKELAPNAISSFIWSIVANDLCVIPILGLIFSIIALTKSVRGRKIVAQAPERYKVKGLLTAAFIISIIDLVGSIIGPIILASYFSLLDKIFDFSEISDVFTGFALL